MGKVNLHKEYNGFSGSFHSHLDSTYYYKTNTAYKIVSYIISVIFAFILFKYVKLTTEEDILFNLWYYLCVITQCADIFLLILEFALYVSNKNTYINSAERRFIYNVKIMDIVLNVLFFIILIVLASKFNIFTFCIYCISRYTIYVILTLILFTIKDKLGFKF